MLLIVFWASLLAVFSAGMRSRLQGEREYFKKGVEAV